MNPQDDNLCPHCGEPTEDDEDIMHRGCRLRTAFPDAYTSEGGILKFDVEKIAQQLGIDLEGKSK